VASIERTAYPRFKRTIAAKELREAFTPGADEVAWAREAIRAPGHLLGLVVLLKCFQRRTTSKRWSYSQSIADQPYGTFPADSGRPRFEMPVGEDLTRVLGRGVLPVQIAESWAGQGWGAPS